RHVPPGERSARYPAVGRNVALRLPAAREHDVRPERGAARRAAPRSAGDRPRRAEGVLLMRRTIALGAATAALGLALALPARAVPRIDYHGLALTQRQMESLAQGALKAPGDSAALEQALGAVIGRLQEMGHLDARAHARWEGGRERLVIETREGPRYR